MHIRFWGHECLSHTSISKRYPKSDAALWVEKSITSRACAHDTWIYWSSESALHERLIAERWCWVWMERFCKNPALLYYCTKLPHKLNFLKSLKCGTTCSNRVKYTKPTNCYVWKNYTTCIKLYKIVQKYTQIFLTQQFVGSHVHRVVSFLNSGVTVYKCARNMSAHYAQQAWDKLYPTLRIIRPHWLSSLLLHLILFVYFFLLSTCILP